MKGTIKLTARQWDLLTRALTWGERYQVELADAWTGAYGNRRPPEHKAALRNAERIARLRSDLHTQLSPKGEHKDG